MGQIADDSQDVQVQNSHPEPYQQPKAEWSLPYDSRATANDRAWEQMSPVLPQFVVKNR